jgi:two-component system, NtrC family, sensor kinase
MPSWRNRVPALDEQDARSSDELRAYPILYVDDEPQNLVTLRYALDDRFTILTAQDGNQAIQMLNRENVAVLLCDQRMPGMSGVEVCRYVSEHKPEVVRIILTAYADLQTAVDAINLGQVLRYVTKPWRNDELVDILQSAIELVRLRQTVGQLQARVLRGLHPPLLEAALRQVANDLHVPIAQLGMNSEQVDDLIEAGLLNWNSPERALELLRHAQSTHREAREPMRALRDAVARLGRGQGRPSDRPTAPCDVVRVVRAAERIAGPLRQRGLRVELVLSASPVVRMEASDLGQVLLHLLMNAAQALERRPEPGVISVTVSADAGACEIAVSDDGPGFGNLDLDSIFDMGVTTRPDSAGVGLAMVKHLVQQAGGTVFADRPVAGGARVVVRLPRLR